MAGDLSEDALGRQKQFNMGYVSTGYLIARGNEKAKAQYHYSESEVARQKGDEGSRAHHHMEMTHHAGKARDIAKGYKPPGRAGSFYSAIGHKATLGKELNN